MSYSSNEDITLLFKAVSGQSNCSEFYLWGKENCLSVRVWESRLFQRAEIKGPNTVMFDESLNKTHQNK